MTLENVMQKRVDRKNAEEKFIVKKFIEYHNRLTRSEYEFKCRPEDKADPISKGVKGTYDFLYLKKDGKAPELAIELAGFYKSEENVRQTYELEKFIFTVEAELRKNYQFDKRYVFFLRFKDLPPKKDNPFYTKTLISKVREFIDDYNGKNLPRSIKIPELPLIREFRLIAIDEKMKGVNLDFSIDNWGGIQMVGEICANAFSTALADNNEKLGIPKKEGKKTILLVINNHKGYIFADAKVLEQFFPDLPLSVHEYIDEIYFLNDVDSLFGAEIKKIK